MMTRRRTNPDGRAHRDRTATNQFGLKVVPCTIKHQYYQTSSHVTITLLAQQIKEEDCTIDIREKTLVVKVRKNDTEMTVISGELYDPVVVDDCKVKHYNSKVDIKLKKKEQFNWNELLKGDLIGEKKIIPPTRRPVQSTTSTATPYASQRDWNRLEKEMEAELEKDKPEGEEALNKLFAEIYGKATPETRRAMNKSFQTSGGTVLSTNWGDVEKTDYEDPSVRQAPAGWRGRLGGPEAAASVDPGTWSGAGNLFFANILRFTSPRRRRWRPRGATRASHTLSISCGLWPLRAGFTTSPGALPGLGTSCARFLACFEEARGATLGD